MSRIKELLGQCQANGRETVLLIKENIALAVYADAAIAEEKPLKLIDSSPLKMLLEKLDQHEDELSSLVDSFAAGKQKKEALIWQQLSKWESHLKWLDEEHQAILLTASEQRAEKPGFHHKIYSTYQPYLEQQVRVWVCLEDIFKQASSISVNQLAEKLTGFIKSNSKKLPGILRENLFSALRMVKELQNGIQLIERHLAESSTSWFLIITTRRKLKLRLKEYVNVLEQVCQALKNTFRVLALPHLSKYMRTIKNQQSIDATVKRITAAGLSTASACYQLNISPTTIGKQSVSNLSMTTESSISTSISSAASTSLSRKESAESEESEIAVADAEKSITLKMT